MSEEPVRRAIRPQSNRRQAAAVVAASGEATRLPRRAQLDEGLAVLRARSIRTSQGNSFRRPASKLGILMNNEMMSEIQVPTGRRSPSSEAGPAELPPSCRQKHLRLDVSPRSSRNMQLLALSLAIDGFRRACIRQHSERIRHPRALCDGNGRFGHIRRSCDLGRLGHGRSGDDHRRSGIEVNTLGPFAIRVDTYGRPVRSRLIDGRGSRQRIICNKEQCEQHCSDLPEICRQWHAGRSGAPRTIDLGLVLFRRLSSRTAATGIGSGSLCPRHHHCPSCSVNRHHAARRAVFGGNRDGRHDAQSRGRAGT